MPIISETELRAENVLNTAKQMIVAARTAPKARGVDNLEIVIADHKEIKIIAHKMMELSQTDEAFAFFSRDATNILKCDYLVLIGTRIKSLGLKGCNLCGFSNCDEKDKNPDVPCVFNTNDLGIAIGSAVSVASNLRVDNRVMFSVGKAALELKILGEDVKIIFGIPLSISAKNIFFDRK